MSNELVKADQYKTELEYAREFAKMVVGTGKWNKDWNIDTVTLLGIYAGSLGLHPVQAVMTGFDLVDNKITMKPQQMSAMIRKSGHSLKITQHEDRCVIEGRRKDNGDTLTVQFSVQDATKAGLINKNNWKNYLPDMLYSKAMGRIGRMLFADVIGGAYCEGEIDEPEEKPAKKPRIDPEAITIDMETGEYEPRVDRTLEDLHLECGVGTIGDVQEYVKFVSIHKHMTEQEGINWVFSQDNILNDFREKLTKRIEKKLMEVKPEVVS